MQHKDYHILVIDDDHRLRKLLEKFFVSFDYRVSSAESAEEGQKLIESNQFDIVVLDIMLPGQSGLEYLETLKKEHKLPVLLLTARGDPEDRIQGLERGADDYLSKPFEPQELVLRINNILQKRA